MQSPPPGLPEWVEANGAGLLRFARGLCGNWATAEDLVQEALAAAWPRWATLTRTDRPDLYVRRVILTQYLRGERRRWRSEIPTAPADLSAGHLEAGTSTEDREGVVRALQQLSPRQRAVIVLTYFLDLSEVEAAQTLGCSRGSIKRHKHDGLARLRKLPELANIFNGGPS